MEEYANNFLEFLRYVKYIKDEKLKIQHSLSGFPHSYKEIIEFYEPRNLEEAIRKAIGTKRKVSEVVEKFPLVMNGWVTCVDVNVIPLGSYDVLIGMDWVESHRVKLDCYHKTFECRMKKGTREW